VEHPASDDDDDDNDDDLDDFDEVLSVQDIANTHGILMFQTWIFFSPPENDSFRKNFCFAVVYFFFPSRNLRAPWADRREILHDALKCVRFYNPGPKFWGSLPKKFLGAKNMQNLARFRSTSKFGGQFLRNR